MRQLRGELMTLAALVPDAGVVAARFLPDPSVAFAGH